MRVNRQDTNGDLVFVVRVKALPASHESPRSVAWRVVAELLNPALIIRYGPECRAEVDESDQPCEAVCVYERTSAL